MAARIGAQLLSVVEMSLALSAYDALQFFELLPETGMNSRELRDNMTKVMSDPEMNDLKHRPMSLKLEKFDVMSAHNQNTSKELRGFLSRDESSKSRSKRRRSYFDWTVTNEDETGGCGNASKIAGSPSEVCIEEFWRNLVFPELSEELNSDDVITNDQIRKEKEALQKHHTTLRPSSFKVYDDKDLQKLFPKIVYAAKENSTEKNSNEGGDIERIRSPRKHDLQRAQLFTSILDFLVSTLEVKERIETKFADHAIITAERFDQRASDLTAPFAPVQEEGDALLRIPFTIASFALMRYAFHKENMWNYLSSSIVKRRLPVPALTKWVLCSPLFMAVLIAYFYAADLAMRNFDLKRSFTLNKLYDELSWNSKVFFYATSYLTQEGFQAFVTDVLGKMDAKKEFKGEERRRYRDLIALQNLRIDGKDGKDSEDDEKKITSENDNTPIETESDHKKFSDLDFFYDTNFIRVYPGATLNDPYTMKRVQWTIEKPALDNVLYTGCIFNLLRCTPHMSLFSTSVYTALLYAIESDERQNMWTNWFERPLNSAQDFMLSFMYQTSMNLAYMSTGLSAFGLVRPIVYSSLSSLYCINSEFNGRRDILHRDTEYRKHQFSEMHKWRKDLMTLWRDKLNLIVDVFSSVGDSRLPSWLSDIGTVFTHLHRDSEQTKELSLHLAAYLFWSKQLAPPLQDKLRCFEDSSMPAHTHHRKGGEQREQHERELEDSNIAIDLGRYRHSIKKDNKVQAEDILSLLETLDHLLDICTLYYKEAELTTVSNRVHRFAEHSPVGQKAAFMTSLTPDLARRMVGAPVGDELCNIDLRDLQKRMIPASQMDEDSRIVDEMDYRARKLMTLGVLKWCYPSGLTFEKLEKEMPTLLTYFILEKLCGEGLHSFDLPEVKIFLKFLLDNRSMAARGIPQELLKDMPYICRFLPYTFEHTNDSQSREAVMDIINNYYTSIMLAQIREATSFAKHNGKAFWNENILRKVDRKDFEPLKTRLKRKLDVVTKCESMDYLNNLGMTEHMFRQMVLKYNSAVGSQYFELKNDWIAYLRSEKHYSKIYKAFIQEIMKMKPNN